MKRFHLLIISLLLLLFMSVSVFLSYGNDFYPTITLDDITKYQQELTPYDEKEVHKISAGPGSSLEDEGRKVLKKDVQKDDSITSIVMHIPQEDSSGNEKQVNSIFSTSTNYIPDDLGIHLRSKDTTKPNIQEGLTGLAVASEITKESRDKIPNKDCVEWSLGRCVAHVERAHTEDDLNDFEDILSNAGIFSGEALSCTNYYDFVNPLAKRCNVKVKIKPYYQCGDKGGEFHDYDSCAATCDSVCKKNTDFKKPKMDFIGFDVGDISGVTESDKRLAVARKFDECYYEGSSPHKKKLKFVSITVGTNHHYCCFSNPMLRDLNIALKEQLSSKGRQSHYSCSQGIPFSEMDNIDLDAPEIKAIMKKRADQIIDDKMLQDLGNKYNSKPRSNQPANKLKTDMNIETNKRRIPVM